MDENTQLLLIRGAIASMPEGNQQAIKEAADKIREIAKASNNGMMALALVGAEIAAED